MVVELLAEGACSTSEVQDLRAIVLPAGGERLQTGQDGRPGDEDVIGRPQIDVHSRGAGVEDFCDRVPETLRLTHGEPSIANTASRPSIRRRSTNPIAPAARSRGPITFAGHFEIGERITDLHRETIARALEDAAPLSILVNDLGAREKLAAYLYAGLQGLVACYSRRRACSVTRGCVHSQLPAEAEVVRTIDLSVYKKAATLLARVSPGLAQALRTTDPALSGEEGPAAGPEFACITRETVLPALIADRLQEYGLEDRPSSFYADTHRAELRGVTLFSEQNLLNLVGRRTRCKNAHLAQSWHRLGLLFKDPESAGVLLGLEEVRSQGGSPLCRGIMLALYQEVRRLGFTSVLEHYPRRTRLSLAGAQDLFRAIGRRFPQDAEWQLAFRTYLYDRERRGAGLPGIERHLLEESSLLAGNA
jgi:hypothetical protein